MEALDLRRRGKSLEGHARQVVAVDELVLAPALDERRVALGRHLQAVKSGTFRIAERAPDPRGRTAFAGGASDLENLANASRRSDLLDDLRKRVVRDLGGDELVKCGANVGVWDRLVSAC